MRRMFLNLSIMLAGVALFGLSLIAQTPSAPAATQQPFANLNQLMRGVLYPAANVVFSPQYDKPSDVKQADDPSMATDPLKSTFGGWIAVENASLALAESSNLLLVPGRMCSNGVPAPIGDPSWAGFVQEVRDVSMKAYEAARAKDQEKMIALSEALSNSCDHCHRKWRRTVATRCK